MASQANRHTVALNAHLLSGEASYRSAGIHGYEYNLLTHLPEVGTDFHYAAFVGAGQLSPAPKMRVHRSRLNTRNPLIRILWEQIIAPFSFMRINNDHPADLVHGLAFALPLTWPGKMLVTIHDLSFFRYPERLSRSRRTYLKWITRASTRQATRIIAVSQSVKDEITILLRIPSAVIDVTPHGVGPQYTPLPQEEIDHFRRQNHLPHRFILHIGTLEPRKNLSMLIRAYQNLPQRRQVKLVLAGGASTAANALRQQIDESGLSDDVLLPGFLSEDSLPLWYNAAEIVVYPSLYEGFGLPLLEAMACGTPVVASNTTSMPEVVGSAGLLLPPSDEEAWVDTLAHLLDDPDRRYDLREHGLRQAAKFTWKASARRTVKAYRRALGIEGEQDTTL